MLDRERLIKIIEDYWDNSGKNISSNFWDEIEGLADLILAEDKADWDSICQLGAEIPAVCYGEADTCPFCFSVDLPKRPENKRVRIRIDLLEGEK